MFVRGFKAFQLPFAVRVSTSSGLSLPGMGGPKAPLQTEGSESSGSMGLESSLPEMWRLPGLLLIGLPEKIEVMHV